jgi:hypothetical protein
VHGPTTAWGIAPLLTIFACAQRHIIEGIAAGATKEGIEDRTSGAGREPTTTGGAAASR